MDLDIGKSLVKEISLLALMKKHFVNGSLIIQPRGCLHINVLPKFQFVMSEIFFLENNKAINHREIQKDLEKSVKVICINIIL